MNQLVKWDAQLQQDLDKMLDKAKAANERRYFGKLWFFYHFMLIGVFLGAKNWCF